LIVGSWQDCFWLDENCQIIWQRAVGSLQLFSWQDCFRVEGKCWLSMREMRSSMFKNEFIETVRHCQLQTEKLQTEKLQTGKLPAFL